MTGFCFFRQRELLTTIIDLGEQVSAKVISYDPTNDDNWDLQVQIIDGPHAGATGWMSVFDAHGDDGHPIDMFDRAVIGE